MTIHLPDRDAQLRPKPPSPSSRPSREAAMESVRTLLAYIGEDPDREGLIDTPSRFVAAWNHLFSGYREDPRQLLGRTFEEVNGYDEIVVLRGTRFWSHCEHHVLPIRGRVDIAYLPNGRVVGLSKLSRLVEAYARRLQTQESLTAQIADAIESTLEPLGLVVVVRAEHQCMAMRGVEQCETSTATTALRGVFKEDGRLEARAFRLIED